MLATLSILAFGFLAPWLMAAGAAATSIPIIIHLLNKRKFRIIVWAAMEWLMAAQRRNARRLRFQRWLLLLLRCLALLIIAAGIAQLFLQSSVVAGLFAQQRAIIVIWDDSYSMGYQNPASGTPFDRSRRLITDLLGKLQSADKVMLIRASRGGTQGNAAANKPTLDHAALRAQVSAATLTDASTDLASAFDQAADALKDLQSSAQVRQVLVLTDFSRSSIDTPTRNAGSPDAPASAEHLKKSIAALRQLTTGGHDLHLIDLGSPDQINRAITDLRPRRPVVVAGIPTEFSIDVLNATDQPLLDLPLTLSLDGVMVRTDKITRIDSGSRHNATIEITIPTIGRHIVEARLPGDLLPADDVRRLMVNVRREIPVLLVDGAPGDGGRTSYGSTAFLWAAYYSSQVQASNIFAPRVITELELPTTPLAPFGVVILSDTGDLAPPVRDALKKYVEAGGLLMLFPGEHTNVPRLNQTLGDAGLLPATLGAPVKAPVKLEGGQGAAQVAEGIPFAPESYSHDVVSVFKSAYAEGKQVGFTTVRTSYYLQLGVPPDSPADIILRYAKADGTAGDPAVVAKAVGKGKVVLFASSADTSWNNWGAEPSFLPFIHTLSYYAMPQEDADRLTLRVNQSIDLPADLAPAGAWTGPRDTHLSVSSIVDKDGRARLTSGPLQFSGPYAPAAGDVRPVVVVNPDPEEADIRYVTPSRMAAALDLDPSAIALQTPSLEPPASAAEANAWTFGSSLIGAALGIFALETVLAMFFSMYR